MSKKFHNINFLGHIPFNPDLLLEKGRFRDRPVGILYPDLIKMGIVTEELAIRHYQKYGKKEDRIDKGSLSLNNTSINLGQWKY